MEHTWCPLELLPDLVASHWLTVPIKKIYSTKRQEKEMLKMCNVIYLKQMIEMQYLQIKNINKPNEKFKKCSPMEIKAKLVSQLQSQKLLRHIHR